MPYNDATFRAQFPEFADTAQYPEATISMYYGIASIYISSQGSPCNMLNGDALALALNYMTAHLMTLGLRNAASAASGGTPGGDQGGFEVSATIGEISVSKLAPPATGAWDWWLYQTPYGTALMALLEAISVGGFSVGGATESMGFRRAGGLFF